MKKLLPVALTELADENDKTFECHSQGHIDAIIKLMKDSGDYYQLNRKFESFKMRFED